MHFKRIKGLFRCGNGSAILALASAGLVMAQSAHPHPASGLKPAFAFKMQQIDVAAILPFSNPDAKAMAKVGYCFLVVALADVTPNTTIAPADIDVTVSDGQGGSYKPVAIGFPMGKAGTVPFSMIGQLVTGDMKITGPQKTFVGIIFVVPDSATALSAKGQKFETLALQIRANYSVPVSSRVENLLGRGRVEQQVEGDHWEVE
jgi:hypothetical protein